MKKTITAVAIGIVIASIAYGVMPRKTADAMDANKDGKISMEEYLASVKPRFAQKDANKDGILIQEEWYNPNTFRRMDGDKDGQATLEEYLRASETDFKRYDINSDGFIAENEIQ